MTLCDPMDYSPPCGLSRQEYWSGLPFPSPGHLPNPGTEPGFPTLQADSLPAEPQELRGQIKEVPYVHTAICEIDNQQGPGVYHTAIFCNDLNGKRM